MTTAYPLQWPDGWPRQKHRENDTVFRGKIYGLTMARARDQLMAELQRLNATGLVISSNVQLRQDGLPYSEQRRIADPGVAVYFQLKKRPMVMAQDRYVSVAGNMRSIGLAIEAMRQLARHGGGTMMERAFSGFAAIAPPDWKKPWREVFGVPADWRGDADTLPAIYREKAKIRHPDYGGSATVMAELNIAYEEAKKEFGL